MINGQSHTRVTYFVAKGNQDKWFLQIFSRNKRRIAGSFKHRWFGNVPDVLVIDGGERMEMIGLLAPIAFVFALAALAQVETLKKEVESMKTELKALRSEETA